MNVELLKILTIINRMNSILSKNSNSEKIIYIHTNTNNNTNKQAKENFHLIK